MSCKFLSLLATCFYADSIYQFFFMLTCDLLTKLFQTVFDYFFWMNFLTLIS
jgi:hypothetical protein